MRKAAICVVLVVFLAGFSWSVFQKEDQLANGRVALLEIMPVDPRSIMQGDYMALDFTATQEISDALWAEAEKIKEDGSSVRALPPDAGKAVFHLDERGVGKFVRLDDGKPLEEGEVSIQFRRNADSRSGVRIASGAFFFQEGFAHLYERASYAQLRLDEDGRPLIANLLDEKCQRIVIPKVKKNPDEPAWEEW